MSCDLVLDIIATEPQVYTVFESFRSGEITPDNIDDNLEKIVSKYNPAFDWKTQTPTRQDTLNAVINAVVQYFSTQNQTTKQEILNDVIQLVTLYFSLPT